MMFLKVFLILMLFSPSLLSEETNVYVVVQKKLEEKKRSRWSLSDWIDQQQRVKLMDHWLAMNTTELGSEFRFRLSQNTYSDQALVESQTNDYEFQYFYRFIGLEYAYSSSDQEVLYDLKAIKLNLIGSSQQSTHLNLGYGIVESDLMSQGSRASTYTADGDLYLASWLGLNFSYWQFNEDSSAVSTFTGFKRENALFIESGFLRIFYSVFGMKQEESGSVEILDGSKVGLEFHF
ncbi:MAG: hypothetical protein AB8E15_07105 [Bdellovibrionales bacterium]